MRTKLAVLAIMAFALSGCASSPGAVEVEAPDGDELNGSWQLSSATDDSGTFDLGDLTVTLEIDDDRASGKAPCNTYTGDFAATADGVDFGGLASTRMACSPEGVMKLETRYLAALEAVDTATLDGDTLTLGLNDDVLELIFTEAEEAPASDLIGEWQLTKASDADGEMTITGTPATLIIAEDSISGRAQCNTFTGDATIHGTSITIGTIAQTLMACADDAANDLETRFLTALESVTTAEVGNGTLATLTLTGPNETLNFTIIEKKAAN